MAKWIEKMAREYEVSVEEMWDMMNSNISKWADEDYDDYE